MTPPLRLLTTALKYGTLLSTACFAACVLLQIFARLALPTAPSWTEEAARLFFVLAVGFAAGLALRSGDYVEFDFVYRRLPPRAQRLLGFAICALTVLLFALFTVAAARFTLMGLAERSPSLRFPMAIPFASMLLLGGGVLSYAFAALRRVLAKAPHVPKAPSPKGPHSRRPQS